MSFSFLIAQVDYDRQVENFAKEISTKIDSSKHYKIGILEFINTDKIVSQLGEILADDISAELSNLSVNLTKFEVLERSRLDQIFKEKNLIKSYDSKDATELGKINAVNILVIGTIVPFGDYYKLTIKLLDTKTGSVLSSTKGQLAKTKAIDDLYDKNNSNSVNPNSNTTTNKPTLKTEKNNSTGWVEIENNTNISLIVYISTEQAVQYLKATKFEQVTISSNATDKIPSLDPGIYYLCARINTWSNECLITKKFVIKPGLAEKIILKF